MTIAALPDHNRLNDPLWLGLFHAYRAVILPLRHNGWTTDVELCSGEYHVRADLGDGTELIIASEGALPADPADVTGWLVQRRSTDENADSRHMVYDSTPAGSQRHHGNALVPLFARIDKLYAARGSDGLIVSSCHIAPYGATHKQTAGVRTPGAAIAQYLTWSDRLVTEEGYRHIWERPDDEGDPLGVFESVGHITTVRVTRTCA
ncbi:hypothetical protein [Streptomyces jumonjinensis]|uniref:Uncharacterized protein n=1 Tax=Streptomyces jumonjinensis TaxID=1945 RepID=A0A646KWR0_STRJU|nr:hypothetical protein [Streptomyces jumonjinensis]MQT05446.1 hypothetical protein [Streptomyces jumonjinensis]